MPSGRASCHATDTDADFGCDLVSSFERYLYKLGIQVRPMEVVQWICSLLAVSQDYRGRIQRY
eukprot:5134412-Pyramimonas_sp.AAC.1